MTNSNDYPVCEPPVTADACIIWLHGLGADGTDFIGIIDQLGLPPKHTVRFIFPNAPFIHVTVNQGMKMRGWYDIYDLNLLRKEDEEGVKNSQEYITKLMQSQIEEGIPSNRIILAGFSQGGAISLYTGLRAQHPIAGIVALSCYLPLADTFMRGIYPGNHNTPIFMAHGMFDPVVPFHAGKSTWQYLVDQDYKISWNTYPMAHTVTADEIYDIGKFICGCLGYA